MELISATWVSALDPLDLLRLLDNSDVSPFDRNRNADAGSAAAPLGGQTSLQHTALTPEQ
jgi:hypothetical protein